MRYPGVIRRFTKERMMLKFYKQFIDKKDLCFDVGANIGERTDIFLKLGAEVVTVEPQKSCIDILAKKYKNSKKVNLQALALGSNKGISELKICDETSECSTLSQHFIDIFSKVLSHPLHWQRSEMVKVTTLDNLIEQFGKPKLLKLDVEGYESEVFKGLTTPVKFICFEFNYPLIADTIKSLEVLNITGNFRCNFIKYEMMRLVLPEWMPLNTFKNDLLEIITPDILTGEIIVECLETLPD